MLILGLVEFLATLLGFFGAIKRSKKLLQIFAGLKIPLLLAAFVILICVAVRFAYRVSPKNIPSVP